MDVDDDKNKAALVGNCSLVGTISNERLMRALEMIASTKTEEGLPLPVDYGIYLTRREVPIVPVVYRGEFRINLTVHRLFDQNTKEPEPGNLLDGLDNVVEFCQLWQVGFLISDTYARPQNFEAVYAALPGFFDKYLITYLTATFNAKDGNIASPNNNTPLLKVVQGLPQCVDQVVCSNRYVDTFHLSLSDLTFCEGIDEKYKTPAKKLMQELDKLLDPGR